MSWARMALPLAAVVLVLGCGGSPSAAPGASPDPSPTPSLEPMTFGTWSPIPALPSPTPSEAKSVACGEIPLPDSTWYFREEAVPPATCAQARSILPAAVKRKLDKAPFVVDGWRCAWEVYTPTGQYTGNVNCTNGARTIKAVYEEHR